MASSMPVDQPQSDRREPVSVVEIYNQLGNKFEDLFPNVPAHIRSLEWLIANLPSKSKIMDLGSGTGRPTASMLVEAGHEVKGIDISPVMVKLAQERVPQAIFEEADARNYEPTVEEKGNLDAITAYSSFIAGVSYTDIINLPKRVYTWLKPGGIFVSGWVIPPGVKGENLIHNWMGNDVVVSILPKEDLVEAITAANFEILELIEAIYTPNAVESGFCKDEEVSEEPQLFIYARKK